MSTPNDENTPLEDVLLAAVDHLAVAATELKGAYRFSRQLKVILGVSAFAMVLLVGIGVGLIVIALQNRSNGAATRESIATIKDCTEATGRCYQQQHQQAAQSIARVIAGDIEGFIVVSECSRSTTTDAALERCVRHRLFP